MRKPILGVIFALVLSLSLLVHDHREETCFSSASCVLHRIGAEKGLVVVYHKEGEWRVITYENGTLSEIKAALKRSPIVKRITVEKQEIKTKLNYSPVSFTVGDIPTQNGYETAMIVKVNGKVRALEGEEIKGTLGRAWNFKDLLKKFNGVRFIFADRAEEPSIDGNPLIGGYLVMPSPSKCAYSTWFLALGNQENGTLLAIYPTWNVSGRVENLSSPVINVTEIPKNLTVPCNGQELLINASGITVNPFPMKLLEESTLECPVVEKTTIHFNGTTESLKYMITCVTP